ncbi:transmembrane protein, putative [Medicago truncatula]|uniref:Transmembrane protein, putative n=1 Tax=Medicago truncatula TaxID=3880 RepID=A0A072VX88_MEDTR|nr:transmembrane protein, putative [Medicago truncatula]
MNCDILRIRPRTVPGVPGNSFIFISKKAEKYYWGSQMPVVLCKKFRMSNISSINNLTLYFESYDPSLYRRIIGRLLYLANTRQYILCFVLGFLLVVLSICDAICLLHYCFAGLCSS